MTWDDDKFTIFICLVLTMTVSTLFWYIDTGMSMRCLFPIYMTYNIGKPLSRILHWMSFAMFILDLMNRVACMFTDVLNVSLAISMMKEL